MKINLKGKNVKDLEGNDFPDSDMAKLTINALLEGAEGDAIRLYELSMKLNTGECEVNESELELIETRLKASRSIFLIGKAQILLELKKFRL